MVIIITVIMIMIMRVSVLMCPQVLATELDRYSVQAATECAREARPHTI